MKLKIKQLDKGLPVPCYAKPGDAGMDLYARSEIVIEAGRHKLIPTGIAVAIEPGYEMQIRPRSGLAFNRQITVLNTPGTIDCGYRGEIGVILQNHAEDAQKINRGDRIAQAVIAPVATAQVVVVDDLDDTERGSGGFGSTGVNDFSD